MASERKLDMFAALAAIDTKQTTFYDQLSDEEKKGYVPSVTARWMSGVNDPQQVMIINEFLNPYLFSLYKHPELLWQLSTVCSSGRKRRYQWMKAPSNALTGKTHSVRLIMEYFRYTSEQANEALPLLAKEDILAMAADLGWQADEIAKLKRELK